MEQRLSEVLAALSHALDITEGQPRGHAERSCLIAMRLADAAGMHEQARTSLFYAALVKDAGCSSTAAKVAALYGRPDGEAKAERRLIDMDDTGAALRHVARAAAPGSSPWRRIVTMGRMIGFGRSGARTLVSLRCDRGADVARHVGLDALAERAIRDMDEHWDGRGFPDGLRGEAISLPGRILCLAQCAEVFWRQGGAAAAVAVARERSGTWFDPALVEALCALEHDTSFWTAVDDRDLAAAEPQEQVLVADDAALDRIAEAFAMVIDAKSPYTADHSSGVADVAVGLATRLGLGEEDVRDLRRAGLLHDIGKLGVSNRVLDKPGPLTEDEWAVVLRHPRWSFEVLARVSVLQRVALLSGAHHERLDGSGYHQGLTASELDLPSRILAVADVAEALSATRPYRPALGPDEVLSIVRAQAGTALDARVVDALDDVLLGGRDAAAIRAA